MWYPEVKFSAKPSLPAAAVPRWVDHRGQRLGTPPRTLPACPPPPQKPGRDELLPLRRLEKSWATDTSVRSLTTADPPCVAPEQPPRPHRPARMIDYR
jgi:hypothetical protein